MVGIIGFQILLAGRTAGERHIAVVDGSTTGYGRRFADRLGQQIKRFHMSTVSAHAGQVDSLLADSLQRIVEAKQLDGYLIIKDSTVEHGTAEYRGSNVSSVGDIDQIEAALRNDVFAARLERQGIDPTVVRSAQVNVRLDTKKISGATLTNVSSKESFVVGFGMAIILFIAILLYAVNVMSSVLEEKTTKVVEVLISSLRPSELMAGKVIGAGAVGLVQLGVWLTSAKLLSQIKFSGQQPQTPSAVAVGFHFPAISGGTLAILIIYFLLGYFLYASIYAAVGAISGNEQEARQAQVPVQLMLMIPYLAFFGILNDPNSSLAVTMSLVPFWSPIAVPVRWGATQVPIGQLVLSIGILLVTVIVVTWAAARIYRVGILMTGKRPNLREIVRWVRAA